MGDPRESDLGRGLSSINWGQGGGGASAPVMDALAGGNGNTTAGLPGADATNAAIFSQKIDAQNNAAKAQAGKNRSDYDALLGQQDEAARQAAQKAKADQLNSYNLSQQNIADEDAFTRARNAARRAQGQTLFGAWG